MKSVIVTAHDYGELKLIHTARRLYQRDVAIDRRQDLARRFSLGFSALCEKFHDVQHDPATDPDHHAECTRKCIYNSLPGDIQELISEIDEYQSQLDDWGLKDYQVNSLGAVDRGEMLYTFLHALVIMICATIPSLILNAPVGVAASFYARREAKKDLAASRVKLAARDVLLSKKIVFSILAVPSLLLTYGILLRLFTSWETRTIVVLMLCCPLLSYIGVISIQAGMVDLKDLRPGVLRLLPGFRSQSSRLPALRSLLQGKVRVLVKKYGPQLGPLYFDKDFDLVAFSGQMNQRISAALNNDVSEKVTIATPNGDSNGSGMASPLRSAKVFNEIQSIERITETPQCSGGDFILPLLPSLPEFDDSRGGDVSNDGTKKTR